MKLFYTILAVGSGSFIGGSIRYIIGYLTYNILYLSTIYSTSFINIIGSFFIGILSSYFSKHITGIHFIQFLIPGLLGGFTTFSTFSLEFINLINKKEINIAMTYFFISIIFSFVGVVLGMKIGKLL